MARLTIHEAARTWGVNRRTILRWITGKDATGRGKRLVEGQDYEIVDGNVPGRKMYVLLRESYPMPSTTPIPFTPRGPVMTEPEPVAPETMPEEVGVEDVTPESAPESAPTDRYSIAVEAEGFPEGTPLREQLATWIPTLTNDPEALDNPVGSTGRVVAIRAMEAVNETSLSNLSRRGQNTIEVGLHRVLDPSPLAPKAKSYVGGLVLEYIAKFYPLRLSATYPQGYWPKTPVALSGLASFDDVNVDDMLPPY